MAQGTKGAVGQPATNASSTTNANGLTSTSATPGVTAVNRKKQKRREKEAAKRAAAQELATPATTSNPNPKNGQAPHYTAHDSALELEEEEFYSDDDDEAYAYASTNGHAAPGPNALENRPKARKKANRAPPLQYPPAHVHHHTHTHPQARLIPLAPHPHTTSGSSASGRSGQHVQNHQSDRDRIWNTSTQEERERIKEFWQSLGEDERKSLVKIEKEAVLRKMKEQQKHSCSCTVCGRKRTAIEEELEVLYDAYYDELEQYAYEKPGHAGLDPMFPYPKSISQHSSRLHPDGVPPLMHAPRPSRGHIQELADGDEDDDDDEEYDEDVQEYSEEEFDNDVTSDEEEKMQRVANDFFHFGNSLTVKGGILTVADDLLKNDGKKFIEMMEQLAERRMQREEAAQYGPGHSHSGSYSGYNGHTHGAPPEQEDFDDEDEEDYDSQDEYEEEEDEMETLTEDQRMEEGRRMFQIFAARMFEQRVLTAYREMVAAERQKKLIEELEEEKSHDVQREAKKQRDAQKKKEKKQKAKEAQAEAKAQKEAEKRAAEEAAKALEAQKQQEQRKKREEQRKKKEAERKAQEEERLKKEAEKLRRQQEERERQQEAERKLRDQKQQEKKARDDAKRKERDEREAKEREAREKKAHDDKQRRDAQEKAKAEKEAQEKARRDAAQASLAAKRVATAAAVAVPPGLQRAPSNIASPHIPVATPAIPKAPTPVRARQGSQHGSKGSSPKTPKVLMGQLKATSPNNAFLQQHSMAATGPRTNIPKSSQPVHNTTPYPNMQPGSPGHTISPPPGMPVPQGFGLPPPLNGYQHSQGSVLPSITQRAPIGHNMGSMFPQHPPPGTNQFRQFPPISMPQAPPGISAPGMAAMGRAFTDTPPGFQPQLSTIGSVNHPPGFGPVGRDIGVSHAGSQHIRQSSGSSSYEQPIGNVMMQRPAPIQRPSSVKPHEGGHEGRTSNLDVDELSNHLGSSALLDDADDPIPPHNVEARRVSATPALPRAGSGISGFGASPIFPPPANQQRMDPFALASVNNPNSGWSNTPPTRFGQANMTPAGPAWGSPPGGWPTGVKHLDFPLGTTSTQRQSRPLQIRVNVCLACRQLKAAGVATPDGFLKIGDILQLVGLGLQPPATVQEILDICETEGTAHNGGGLFSIQTPGPTPAQSLVRFEPANEGAGMERTGTMGEIGSPNIGSSMPATGGGSSYFPGLGALPNNFH